MPESESILEVLERELDFAGAQVDPELLVREFADRPLPHDPELDELSEAAVIQVAECPICGCSDAVPRFAVRGTSFRLVVCADCGLGSLDPKPTPEAVARFYPPEYYGSAGAKFAPFIESMVRKSASWTAKGLTRHLPQGSRVLDVGCGRGVLLSTIADLGFEAHGFEISGTAALGADPRAKIAIGSALREAEYPAAAFDLVVLCHVLEHLPNPRETLVEIERILKPGGRLVVSVPNFSSWQAELSGSDWFHLDLPRHLYHFPAAGLRRLLENTGFTCRSESHFSLAQNPFGWVQSLLNRYGIGPRNSLYTHLKRVGRSQPGTNRLKAIGLSAAYWLGMPIGLTLSAFSAAFRSGATITIIAEAGTRTSPSQTIPPSLPAEETIPV